MSITEVIERCTLAASSDLGAQAVRPQPMVCAIDGERLEGFQEMRFQLDEGEATMARVAAEA